MRYCEYNVLHWGIVMCGVSYDVTGDVPVTLPSSVFYTCVRDTIQTAD